MSVVSPTIDLYEAGSVDKQQKSMSVTDTYKIIFPEGGGDKQSAWNAFFSLIINQRPNNSGLDWEKISISESESAGTLYLGNVVYSTTGTERENKRRYPQYTFSTKGGTAHIVSSLQTLGGIVINGRRLPDFKRGINVDKNGPQGVDIVCPAWQHSMSLELPASTVTWSFLNAFASMTGKINSSPIWMFGPGELLFLGMDGSSHTEMDPQTQRPETWYNISWDFEGMPSTQVKYDNMRGFLKKRGFDYVWTYNEERASEDCTISEPVAAYCERVYHEADFSIFNGFLR